MKEPRKLKHGEMHLLRLVRNGQGADGWAKVGDYILPVVQKLPKRLVEIVTNEDDGGSIRLTHEGNVLLHAMTWI